MASDWCAETPAITPSFGAHAKLAPADCRIYYCLLKDTEYIARANIMDLTGPTDVDEALSLVGELLAAEGQEYAVTILGGAALNLLG